jgi:hypothetical protein
MDCRLTPGSMTIFEAARDSLTYDELEHYRYGAQLLALDATRFDDSKMPFSALNAVVVELTRRLFPDWVLKTWQPERIGHLATIIVGALLGLLIFRWSRQWYGVKAGMLALFLFVFEPNILAHAHLITTDLYAVFTITLSIYCFWKFTLKPNLKWGLFSSLALGLAQLAKYTGVYLYPILAVLALVRFAPEIYRAVRQPHRGVIISGLWKSLAYLMLHLAVSLVLINAGFLFDKTFQPLSSYTFRSELFQSWQQRVEALVDPPVPVSYPYLQGLGWVRYRERTGDQIGKIYLLGQIREGRGFAGYYLVAFILKAPIAMQTFLIVATLIYLVKWKKSAFLKNEWFLCAPTAFFTLYFNFFYNAQIGIRYFLVIFPFLFIFIGSLLREWHESTFPAARWVILGCVYLAVSSLSYFPHHISYFNEIVWNRIQAYHYLADSNLDWGQDELYLLDYLHDHPKAIFDPGEPASGEVIININQLVGVRGGLNQYRWLRDHFKPAGLIAYSDLIFRIDPGKLIHISK